mgnify:CR=1 FL=1
MSNVANIALQTAYATGRPYAHVSGCAVVLITNARRSKSHGLEGDGARREFKSAALARSVGARGLQGMANFPHLSPGQALDAAEMYAAAAYRHAQRRRGRRAC